MVRATGCARKARRVENLPKTKKDRNLFADTTALYAHDGRVRVWLAKLVAVLFALKIDNRLNPRKQKIYQLSFFYF